MPCSAVPEIYLFHLSVFSPPSLILQVAEDCCNTALSYLPLTTNHVTAQEILKAPINVLVFCTGEGEWLQLSLSLLFWPSDSSCQALSISILILHRSTYVSCNCNLNKVSKPLFIHSTR